MHASSYSLMQKLVSRVCLSGRGVVVDVGSQDVNGTYRNIFGTAWDYRGVDISPGKNVDIVMVDEYSIPLPNRCADLVISGQTLEHVRNPFKLVSEMARILKIGSHLFMIAPFVWAEHKYPIDCWRFLPDGMRSLIEDTGLAFVESAITKASATESECYGVGLKVNGR